MDFSSWALQDTARAPPSGAVLWLGVQSLAHLATGRDGKVVVDNAAHRGVKFELGLVVCKRQKTQVVLPMAAPRAAADLFSADIAKQVLRSPSFFARLQEAGAGQLELQMIIDEILTELEVCTPEETAALQAFCRSRGVEGMLPRCGRVNGELVVALIDVVMVAKKCTYEAAKMICHRLLKDYWDIDVDSSSILEGTTLLPQECYSLRLQGGHHGGQATVCVNAATVGEVLVLIPGSELSTQLRRDMVRSFFGMGGAVTFEKLLANPRIRDYFLHGADDNPMGDVLERNEIKLQLNGVVDALQTHKEQLTLAIQQRDEHWQQIMLARDDAWRQVVAEHRRCDEEWRHCDEEWRAKWWQGVEAWRGEVQRASETLTALMARVRTLPFNMGQKISDVISAAVMNPGSALVKNLRAATKKTAVRSTHSARRFPPEQKATQVEVLGSLVSLFSVAIRFFPEMTYDVWKAVRGGFGKAVKKARLQRHALGNDSPDFIARPLLWSFVGEGTAEGGGQRYVVLREHLSLLEAVWTMPRRVGSGRRRRIESLDAEARRVQAKALVREGYVAEAWPLLSAEVEPDFTSSADEEE
jgi:hypothetical protein